LAPASEAPVKLTDLPDPRLLESNCAVPPTNATSSEPKTPAKARAVTVAVVEPSYTLSATVKDPVRGLGWTVIVVAAVTVP
jgi:hypothetical protein